MAQQYGTVKVDNITFTSGGGGSETDITLVVSGLNGVSNSGITVTGTISGETAEFVSGVFTTQVSGATITGDAGEFTSGTFVTATGTTAEFTSGVFTSLSGTTATVTSGVFASGTAAAPSVSVGTTDNGLYSPGTDEVAISTNGTGRLFVNSAGQLGVGTSSFADTTRRQVIHRSDAGSAYLQITNANTGESGANGALIGVNTSSDLRIVNLENADLTLETSNTERLRITSDGKLGLGTSSVLSDFHIASSLPTIRLEDDDVALQASYALIKSSSDGGLQFDADPGNARSSTAITFDIDGGEIARLTPTGLGIGTTSPSEALTVVGDVLAGALVSNGNLEFNCDDNSNNQGNDAIIFKERGNERMRMDGSGRLLVGTSSSEAFNGIAAQLQVEGTDSGTARASIYRASNNNGGPAFVFAKSRSTSHAVVSDDDFLGQIDWYGSDGTDTNQIGARISARIDGTPGTNDLPTRLEFSTTANGSSSPTERVRIDSTGNLIKYGNSATARILPQTDDVGYIGQNTKRWQAIYAVNGTIQTSDERQKTEIQTSQLGSDFIRSLRPVSYKWKIGGYTRTLDDKGNEIFVPNPGVRTHYGFIAQEVKQACGDTDFGGWLQEDLSDPKSLQSLRLHEFISPIVKALQEALDEIDTLKAKVAALEAQ